MPTSLGPSRRDFLRSSVAFATATALSPHLALAQNSAFSHAVADYRALAAKTPIKVTPLGPNINLLQGVGGNMVALSGADGTLLVDTSVTTAAPHIEEALTSIKAAPLTVIINTHWHFDHTDGNAPLHTSGRTLIAHDNTLKRLSSPQYMEALDVHFDPAPPAGRPDKSFADNYSLNGNGHSITLQHFAPAHTDSDIYVWFADANVLHVGDIWFNGFYPLIDYSSGGRLAGMIAASDNALKLAKSDTRIVPGHGPLGTRTDLQAYRDMLATVHDRIASLKSSGKSVDEVIAAKPTASFDAQLGKGMLSPDNFVRVAYKAT